MKSKYKCVTLTFKVSKRAMQVISKTLWQYPSSQANGSKSVLFLAYPWMMTYISLAMTYFHIRFPVALCLLAAADGTCYFLTFGRSIAKEYQQSQEPFFLKTFFHVNISFNCSFRWFTFIFPIQHVENVRCKADLKIFITTL